MGRLVAGAAAAVGGLYLLLCGLLFVFQRRVLYFPQPRSAQAGATVMEFASGGERVMVTVVRRAGPHAIVYFGGNAEDVAWNVPEFTREFPEESIYLMHYRGYGGSTGAPSESGIMADGLALVDQVMKEHPHVVVMGRSLGSGVAVRVASERAVDKVVLITPYDSIVGVGAALFPWMPVRWLARERYESNVYAGKVRAPVLIVAAEADEVIPRWSTELLRTRFAEGQARYVVVRGEGHNSISASKEYWRALEWARPD